MEIAKTILTIVYFIIALAMIILALIQTKEDGGLSSTITGSSTNNFYEKNKGTFYYLTRYGHKPHTDFDYSNSNENIYFVFGKESTGIPPVLLKPHLDKCLRIPMTDNVRALNLSNTVAIVTYEALRQQNYNNLLRDEPHKSKTYIEESK